MYGAKNISEYDEGDANSYIKKALLSTISEYPHFMLNKQAIKSLDVLPKLRPDGLPDSAGNKSSRSNTTIFSVLNKCRTQSGQRLLALWLQRPLITKSHIDKRLEIVTHLVENNELRTICHNDYLRKIPDLLRIAYRISKERCSILDLVKIFNTCQSAKSLVKSYRQVIDISSMTPPDGVVKLFGWMRGSCSGLDDFMKLLDDSLVLDKPDENNEYLLKPNASDNIARIIDDLDSLRKKARRELRDIADDVGLEADKSIKLEIDADKGFDIRVTKQNEQVVRGNPGYIQSSAVKKDGYRFTTKALSKLSNRYIDAKAEYKSVSKDVYSEIISQAVMYDEQVLELCMALTVLDVFVALSVSAGENSYICPLILDSESGKIEIEGLRHSCLENQPDITDYVPNDIMLDKNRKKFFLVTGPNMGGKSTYIKSVAVGVIMAQCGSLIPATDGTISIVDGVFTRVGAGDHQAEGISTFMEEMLDMSKILKEATEHSLVIIDELGRGTSTFDGFGLAWSIAKHLATKTKCYGIFATHFHELTEMEEAVDHVGNLHVKAHCQDDKLTMLFHVSQGICDESYGINVARYTDFPGHVIKSASEKLKQFEEVPGFESKKEVREFVKLCVDEIMTK